MTTILVSKKNMLGFLSTLGKIAGRDFVHPSTDSMGDLSTLPKSCEGFCPPWQKKNSIADFVLGGLGLAPFADISVPNVTVISSCILGDQLCMGG